MMHIFLFFVANFLFIQASKSIFNLLMFLFVQCMRGEVKCTHFNPGNYTSSAEDSSQEQTLIIPWLGMKIPRIFIFIYFWLQQVLVICNDRKNYMVILVVMLEDVLGDDLLSTSIGCPQDWPLHRRILLMDWSQKSRHAHVMLSSTCS